MWTTEWPIEPGEYWFYGWCFRDRNYPAKLHLVKVRKIANGVCHITDGHFLYKAEGAIGLWQLAELPELPDDSQMFALALEMTDES